MKAKVDSVYCEFKYSGAGDAFLLTAALATLALVFAMPLAAALQAPLALLVAALAARARVSMRRVRSVRVDGERGMVVEEWGGACYSGVVRDGSFVAPWLTLVRWSPHGARFDRTVLILPGMLAPDAYRRLRVLLRWG
jgi:toxin CptA